MSIYLDNAASGPVDKETQKEVQRGFAIFGNPSSFNDEGRRAKKALEEARTKVAGFLGAKSHEIIFTSSGTEANNLAIKGIIKNLKTPILNFKKRTHIISTQVEHPSVLEPIKHLENEGFGVTYLSVDKQGFVDINELQNAMRPETVLVSVMYANNEIGTIQPILKIGKIINEFRKKKGSKYPLFHVDACQAAGY